MELMHFTIVEGLVMLQLVAYGFLTFVNLHEFNMVGDNYEDDIWKKKRQCGTNSSTRCQ